MIIYFFSLWLCKELTQWHSGARFLQRLLCSTQCHRAKDFRLVLSSNQLTRYFIYFYHIKVVALPTAKPRISGGLSLYRQAAFVSHFPLSISFSDTYGIAKWWYEIHLTDINCFKTHSQRRHACLYILLFLLVESDFPELGTEFIWKWIF